MKKKSEKEKNEDAIRKAVREQLSAKPAPPNDRGNRTRRTTAGIWARPHHSDALGVNPDQIEEATKALRAQGVMADFDKEGRCIITSEKQRREVAKACGLWDGRDGYHGGKKGGRDSRPELTGRQKEEVKREFRRRVDRGEFD